MWGQEEVKEEEEEEAEEVVLEGEEVMWGQEELHSDGDRGDGSARYVLTGEGAGSLFRIDENSGDIHATKRLDREEKAYYILRAKAVDRFTNEALEGESEFVIKIHDINDNEPRFTKDLYMARVPEMSEI
ncbi:hypothetical protein CRUP_022503, partial [Coryphaenoides rupestris]